MFEREQDPSEEVVKQLDDAEAGDEEQRLETIERVHRDLETELEEDGEAPPAG